AGSLRAERSGASVCSSRRPVSVSSATQLSRLRPKLPRISSSRPNTSPPAPPPEAGLMRKASLCMRRSSARVEPVEDTHQGKVLHAAEPLAGVPARFARRFLRNAQAVALEAQAAGDVKRARQVVVLAHQGHAPQAEGGLAVEQGEE